MIKITRLNGKAFYINSDLIEFLEETPDTVITTTTGKKVVVSENVDDIINAIIKTKSKIYYYKDKNFSEFRKNL